MAAWPAGLGRLDALAVHYPDRRRFRDIDRQPPSTVQDADTASTAASAEVVAQEVAAVADALDAAPLPPTPRTSLRDAAALVLAAWDDEDNRETDIIAALEGPMEAQRTLLTAKAPRDANAPRKPREGTKQGAVLTMLRRTEGATVAQIAEATHWATHTVRGFLAGLKKKGFTIATLERVRMVRPNKEGAKGSYTIYCAEKPDTASPLQMPLLGILGGGNCFEGHNGSAHFLPIFANSTMVNQ